MMPDDARLFVEAFEAGIPVGDVPSESDMHNIYVSRLYDASPTEFFKLYAAPRLIGSAHLRADFFRNAVDFLVQYPEAKLRCAGCFGESRLQELLALLGKADIHCTIIRTPLPRAAELLQTENSPAMPQKLRFSHSDLSTSIRISGVKAQVSSAQYWDGWFKAFFSEMLLSGSKIQEEGLFFDFLRETARYTAKPVNWTRVSDCARVSQATGRRWAQLLESFGVFDLINPVDYSGKRRLSVRKKLYWNAPGLALWLSRSDLSDRETLRVFTENALYTALKDAFSLGQFSYALDTNKKEIPLRMTMNGKHSAFFVCRDEKSREIAKKHALGYSKIGLLDEAFSINTDSGLCEAEHFVLPMDSLYFNVCSSENLGSTHDEKKM